jgi:hypothetical protein
MYVDGEGGSASVVWPPLGRKGVVAVAIPFGVAKVVVAFLQQT